MRCKRCGNPLDPMDTRCPVCGKTLTQQRKRAPVQKPSETVVKLPQLDKFTHAYHQDTAHSRMLQMVTVAAVVIAIALLVAVYVGVGILQTSVNQLQQTADSQLQALRDQTQVSTEPAAEAQTEGITEPQTEAPTEAALPLSSQDMEATLTLHHTSGEIYASANLDLGHFQDRVAAWVSTLREGTSSRSKVSWVLENAGDRLDVQLWEDCGSAGTPVDVTLSWTLSGDTFANLSGAVCIWEYRVSGSQWESVPTEYLTPIGGGCQLKMTAEQMTALLAQDSQMELRCHVSLSHADGGTLKLLVDGLVLSQEGMVPADDLPG